MAAHRGVGVANAEAIKSSEHRAWVSKLWNRIDRDKNGRVTKEELNCTEFQDALRSIIAPTAFGKVGGSYSRAEQNVQQLLSYCLRKAGINSDGCFSRKEFESFLRELRNQHTVQDRVGMIFALFDLDGDLHIDKEEFAGIYRFYLGTHPIANEFKAEWDRLDSSGRGKVTKDQFVKWLPRAYNPCFKQHAGEVYASSNPGSPASHSAVSSAMSRRSVTAKPSPAPAPSPKKAERVIFRPAPGVVPRRKEAPEMPMWNENFASKDPSEHNLAHRGNVLLKTYFSRPKSLPELRRFYKTYQGFDSHLAKLNSPEVPPPRKPVLSDETRENLSVPGWERHMPGGNKKNARGEEVPWRELTPRALKRIHREPGTLLLRVPMGTPRFMTPWTERREQLAATRRRFMPSASVGSLQTQETSVEPEQEDAPALAAAFARLDGLAEPHGEALADGAPPQESAAGAGDPSQGWGHGGTELSEAGNCLDNTVDPPAGEATAVEAPKEPVLA